MKIELLQAPKISVLAHNTDIKNNQKFFEKLVTFMLKIDYVDDFVFSDLKRLFAEKFIKVILFDYFLTDKGILVKFADEDVLFVKCNTSEFLNQD